MSTGDLAKYTTEQSRIIEQGLYEQSDQLREFMATLRASDMWSQCPEEYRTQMEKAAEFLSSSCMSAGAYFKCPRMIISQGNDLVNTQVLRYEEAHQELIRKLDKLRAKYGD